MKEVSTIAVRQGGKLLLGRRRDNGKWTTPGGHLDPGEKPLAGAVRELLEETGLKVKASQLKPLESREVKPGLLVHGFLYEPSGEVKTTMADDPDLEVKRWHFVDPAAIEDKDLHVPRKNNVLLPMMEKSAMNHFWNGFEKRAAPKWFRELLKNKRLFKDSFADAHSTWGVMTERAVEKKRPSRGEVGELLLGITPKRFGPNKNFPLTPRINLASLPLTDERRRSLYFKANNELYKSQLNEMLASPEYTALQIENLKRSASKAKDYLEGKGPASFSLPFKKIGPGKNIRIEHYTTEGPSKLLERGEVKRSPSSGHHLISENGVFAFKENSPDSKLFHHGNPDYVKLIADVPESAVVYHPPKVNPKQVDAEIFVRADALKRGVLKRAFEKRAAFWKNPKIYHFESSEGSCHPDEIRMAHRYAAAKHQDPAQSAQLKAIAELEMAKHRTLSGDMGIKPYQKKVRKISDDYSIEHGSRVFEETAAHEDFYSRLNFKKGNK